MKKLLIIFLTVAAALGTLAGCAGKQEPEGSHTQGGKGEKAVYRTLEEIKESGSIKIGVFSDKNPFGYVDANGDYQGYDIYLAKRLAEDLGVKPEFVSTEAANRVEFLETGKVDIILANFTVTKARAEVVDFALPYMKVALGVVAPDSALITRPEQLNGKTLIVTKGTTAETFFSENYPDVKLLKFDQYTEAYNALLDGRGDAFSTDNTEVLAWALQNEGFSVGIDSIGNPDTIAPAVSKGNRDVLDWINKEIEALTGEQFFRQAYKETLEPVYGSEADIDSIIVSGNELEAALPKEEEKKGEITVAASATPHAEILEAAKPLLAEEGWELSIVVFDDYIQPNLVVESGDADANYFQHISYLEEYNSERKTQLVNAGGVHFEPFGIYPGKKHALKELEDGDEIAVPNDTTNEARALLLLEANGIIRLREGAGLKATVKDIEEYIVKIKIQELEAAQVARVKDEVAFVVLNGNYALQAGFFVGEDAVSYETYDSQASKAYVNIVAIKEGNEENEGINALLEVLKSEEIKQYIQDNYDGAVIPYEE